MNKVRILCAVVTILLSALSLFVVTRQGQAASRPIGEAGLGITILPATAIVDLNLSNTLETTVVVNALSMSPGGGGSGGTYTTDGKTYIFDITTTGKVMSNVESKSHDGKASVSIPFGTIAKDKEGKALRLIQIEPSVTVPTLPTGANVMGIPYEYSPNGATFDPAITITFKYDPAKVPEGTDLQLVFWNGSEWIQLTDVVVDPVSGTVSGKTTHFTPFAVLAVPKPVPSATTPPATTPAVTTVTPTSIPTATPTLEPAITPTTPPILSHPPPEPTTTITPGWPESPTKKSYVGWWITGIILVAGLIVTGVVIRIRRRKYHAIYRK